MTDPSYLAIDPGDMSGWATFDDKGNVIAYGQYHLSDQTVMLDKLIIPTLKLCITEDYKNHPWKKQKNWTKNQTSKNIGKIELMCEMRGVKLVLQPNTVKSMGYMYLGTSPPSNHSISHQFDAIAHGVYYLQQNGIRPVGKSLIQNKDT